jgi:hypothetical protein
VKVDLDAYERDTNGRDPRDLMVVRAGKVAALIRVARAAKAFIDCGTWPRKSELRVELVAALSDIEDSKHE